MEQCLIKWKMASVSSARAAPSHIQVALIEWCVSHRSLTRHPLASQLDHGRANMATIIKNAIFDQIGGKEQSSNLKWVGPEARSLVTSQAKHEINSLVGPNSLTVQTSTHIHTHGHRMARLELRQRISSPAWNVTWECPCLDCLPLGVMNRSTRSSGDVVGKKLTRVSYSVRGKQFARRGQFIMSLMSTTSTCTSHLANDKYVSIDWSQSNWLFAEHTPAALVGRALKTGN